MGEALFGFHHTRAVRERFPRHYTAVLGPVDARLDGAAAAGVVAELRERCASSHSAASLDPDGPLRLWREAYSRQGASPRYLCSAEALLRRFLEGGHLYRILPLVDLYNWISLRFLTPMAAYDVERLSGTVSLRFATKGEPFTPLGNPGQTEKTRNGEVVYADEEKVICRYWNLRDSHTTRIRPQSRRVVLFADLVEPDRGRAEAAAGAIADLLARALAAEVGFSVAAREE